MSHQITAIQELHYHEQVVVVLERVHQADHPFILSLRKCSRFLASILSLVLE